MILLTESQLDTRYRLTTELLRGFALRAYKRLMQERNAKREAEIVRLKKHLGEKGQQ